MKLNPKHFAIGFAAVVVIALIALAVKVIIAVIAIVAPAVLVGVLLGGYPWVRLGRWLERRAA
jgi:hypothetical protein